MKTDINALIFGIRLNFTEKCGKERTEEAVEIIKSLVSELEELNGFVKSVSETACLCKIKDKYPHLNISQCISCEAKSILDRK